MRFYVLFFSLLLLAACKPSSIEEFRYEGAAQVRLLIKELKMIETSADLQAAEPVLKKRFDKIADLAGKARLFQKNHPGIEDPVFDEGDMLSDQLLDEMRRVYALEGGRDCLERAQREAMLRLDAGEKALERSRKRNY